MCECVSLYVCVRVCLSMCAPECVSLNISLSLMHLCVCPLFPLSSLNSTCQTTPYVTRSRHMTFLVFSLCSTSSPGRGVWPLRPVDHTHQIADNDYSLSSTRPSFSPINVFQRVQTSTDLSSFLSIIPQHSSKNG